MARCFVAAFARLAKDVDGVVYPVSQPIAACSKLAPYAQKITSLSPVVLFRLFDSVLGHRKDVVVTSKFSGA